MFIYFRAVVASSALFSSFTLAYSLHSHSFFMNVKCNVCAVHGMKKKEKATQSRSKIDEQITLACEWEVWTQRSRKETKRDKKKTLTDCKVVDGK